MDSVCGRAGVKEGEDVGRGFQVLGGGDEFIEVEVDGGIEIDEALALRFCCL